MPPEADPQRRLGDGQPEDRALGAERSTPDSEKGEDKIQGEKGQQKSPAQPLHLSQLPDSFSSWEFRHLIF